MIDKDRQQFSVKKGIFICSCIHFNILILYIGAPEKWGISGQNPNHRKIYKDLVGSVAPVK